LRCEAQLRRESGLRCEAQLRRQGSRLLREGCEAVVRLRSESFLRSEGLWREALLRPWLAGTHLRLQVVRRQGLLGEGGLRCEGWLRVEVQQLLREGWPLPQLLREGWLCSEGSRLLREAQLRRESGLRCEAGVRC
jgi:hypothetical protein